jgi:hypothetical protein
VRSSRLLMSSPEESTTAEANDSSVVNGMFVIRFGSFFADETDDQVGRRSRIERWLSRIAETVVKSSSCARHLASLLIVAKLN